MRQPPHIRHFMTVMPVTIAFDEPLDRAEELMERHGVRHLPVVKDGRLVGLISQRDLALARALAGKGRSCVVEEAMTENVFTCGPEAHVHAVATAMADDKLGSAVIVAAVQPTKVLGVFTTVDALRALALMSGHLD